MLPTCSRLVVTGADATGLNDPLRVIRFPLCPGKAYLAALRKNFVAITPSTEQKFLQSLDPGHSLVVEASPSVATHIALVNGQPHIFLANFKGLVGNRNAVQTPEGGAKIISKEHMKAYFLPFLGEVEELHGRMGGGETTYVLPDIAKGAVVWFDTVPN
jgi:hypothetical protein